MSKSKLCLAFALLLFIASLAGQQPSRDWLTWGGDPQRTNWAKAETTLSPANVSRLELKWKAQLDTVPSVLNYLSTLSDPVVVEGVNTRQGVKTLVFTMGSANTVYAIDAASGKVVWQRTIPNTMKPIQPDSTSCPNSANATPVIDKQNGTIYVLATDGKLRGLSVVDGEDKMPPTDFVTPYSRNWSLNLVDGVVYTTVARGCGNSIANFAAMDVTNPAHPQAHYYTSTGRPSGAWGRGGLVRGPRSFYAMTADGPFDPAAGRFGESFLALTPKDLRLIDSYTPANWQYLNQKDLDLGSGSPVVFPFGNRTLVAGAAKEGVLYLLDAGNLGGSDHHTPLFAERYANDAATMMFRGVWGALSTYEDAQGTRWILAPMQGEPAKDAAPKFQYSYGPVQQGSIMAFKIVHQFPPALYGDKPVAVPVWMSRNLELPAQPTIANGVVFGLSTGDRGRAGAASKAALGPNAKAVKKGGGAQPPGMDTFGDWNATQRGPDGQQNVPDYLSREDLTHGILYAFDGATGKELYASGDLLDSWTHYGGIAIVGGRLYISTWDARVYAFGLK
jgi:outer membrane protein assembly factor BamB